MCMHQCAFNTHLSIQQLISARIWRSKETDWLGNPKSQISALILSYCLLVIYKQLISIGSPIITHKQKLEVGVMQGDGEGQGHGGARGGWNSLLQMHHKLQRRGIPKSDRHQEPAGRGGALAPFSTFCACRWW